MFFHKSSLKIKIAKVLSILLSPIACLFPTGLLIVFSHYSDGSNRIIWGLGAFFFLAVIPAGVLWLGMKKGAVSDVDFTHRQERIPYLIIMVVFWIIASGLSRFFSGPKLITGLFVATTVITLLDLIISLFWKVSNHSMFITAFALLVNGFFGWHYFWFFLLIPIVYWDRLVLKKHTFAQLLGGSALGIVFFLILELFI